MGEQLRWGWQAHLEADIWLAAAAHVSGLVCLEKCIARTITPRSGEGRAGRARWLKKRARGKYFSLYILANPFTWPPSSQLHLLSSHKDFCFVVVNPRM